MAIAKKSNSLSAEANYQHKQNYPSTSGNCTKINPNVVKTAKADPSKRLFADIGGRWNNYGLRGLGDLRLEYALKKDFFAVAIIDIQIHNLSCKQQVVAALPAQYSKFKSETQKIFTDFSKTKTSTSNTPNFQNNPNINKEQGKDEDLENSDLPKDLAENEPKKSKKALLIGGGILALVIIGTLIYFISKRNS